MDRRLLTFLDPDWEQVLTVAPQRPRARSAEDWLREVFERAPAGLRVPIVAGWRLCGAVLGPRDADHVLGWRLAERQPDRARMTVHWRIGLDAEIVVAVGDRLAVGTAVRLCSRSARVVWAVLTPVHRVVVRLLLRLAVRRVAGRRGGP